jgi:hypothetical protein
VDALIEILESWVVRGETPPPTRSDSHLLGAAEGNRALALPEVACPTGAYYIFPPGIERHRAYLTAFAPYDGSTLEPLDGRGYLVDLNHNNVRDRCETIDEAWQRRAEEGEQTGVLLPGQRLTHEAYVRAVEQAASELVALRLLGRVALADYLERARASTVGLDAG